MTRKLETTRNKFGELSSSPIFEDGKVIFPSFTNPELAREGETWEVELVKLIPLNKVDKKGQPMFKGIFVLKRLPIFMLVKKGDRWLTYEGYNIKDVSFDGENVKVIIKDGRSFVYNRKDFFKIGEEEKSQELIGVSLNELIERFELYSEEEKNRIISNIEWKQEAVVNSDEVLPEGRAGRFAVNLRMRTLTWMGYENEEASYIYIPNVAPPLFRSLNTAENYVLSAIKEALREGEAIDFEPMDLCEIVEVNDPTGKKQHLFFLPIKNYSTK
jgi:hypothetical protein